MKGPLVLTLALAVALAPSASGCDDSPGDSPGTTSGGAAAGPGTSPIPLPRLFPLAPGDRWRLAATPGDAVRIEGVTAIDGTGVIAVHGTAHQTAERYRVSDDEVTLVTPMGEALSPILRAPLHAGAEWTYEHRERDVAVPCDVTVVDVDLRETVAGAEVPGCVSLRRRCRYPAGAPFTNSTTHSSDEVYCPGIGLARVRNVFRPAPTKSALSADREERVVGFRVAGSPVGGPSDGCARFILLPTDLVTVCGTDVRPGRSREGDRATPVDQSRDWDRSREGDRATSVDQSRDWDRAEATGEDIADGACRYSHQHGTETLTTVIGAPEGSAPEDALVKVTGGGRSAWVSGRAAACPEASRLAPLLTSLL
ncbi:MAG: hypothetical protein JRH11_07695 [Deltaproteobacteria bacterium]|nr:hypothetical protein [Deltaproteobacteria bacterium]